MQHMLGDCRKRFYSEHPVFDRILSFFHLRRKAIFLSAYSLGDREFIYLPLITGLSCSIVHYFLDIVHHAVQHPLYVDFPFSPKCKVVRSFLGSDIGKHWFHNGHAVWIYLAAFFTVDFFAHGFGVIGFTYTDANFQ